MNFHYWRSEFMYWDINIGSDTFETGLLIDITKICAILMAKSFRFNFPELAIASRNCVLLCL